jgi:hypothetical protein
MSKLKGSVVCLVAVLAFAACTHDQPPPAVPLGPSEAAAGAPATQPPPVTSEEKKSNDGSGSSSPMPDH